MISGVTKGLNQDGELRERGPLATVRGLLANTHKQT